MERPKEKMSHQMNKIIIILFAVFFLASLQLACADYDTFTVNVPNAEGGYTGVVIKKSVDGYLGPQG